MGLLKLVIVDDEPILLEGLVKTYDWNGMGYEVVGFAQSGEQALKVIREKKPHVVLTDIRMKQISGLMVMEEIKKENPECQFVVLSAYRDFEYAKKACDLGAFAYLLKPIEDEKLQATMTDVGKICEDQIRNEEKYDRWERLLKKDGDGFLQVVVRGKKIEGGILQAYRQEETGMVIFTLVPDMVLNQGMTQILIVLLTIYAVIAVLAFVLSLYASQTFTRPIRQISDAMTSFDGNDFTHTIQIHTDTELDKIGHAYNEMLKNIEEFQNEVKNQQKELRISEMNTLISQINPHFLYNTLDTIYMLARINGEEKTMKMIQALSKYLRLSLSKGREIVTVEDELENVKSYMEIQQIRNENLFHYEIECGEELKTRWILKLILQPIVENAVKYGFCDIFEGGLIRISVTEQAGQLTFSVYNNGTPMEEQIAEKLNGLSEIPVSKMKDSFEDKKHGYGVINIITRLRLKYGEDVRVFYESDTNGTVCVIQIPDDGKENSEQ